MTEKPYHHGDLRNALIEAGIDLINENGAERFSLRGAAAACGVSHTAPYAHFKDVDALLRAMREHVTALFAQSLRAAVEDAPPREITMALGKAYIAFFAEHPNYFQFLYHRSGLPIDLDDVASAEYPPFVIFRDAAYQTFRENSVPPPQQHKLLLHMWALVHGITALLTNPGVRYSGKWEDLIFVDIQTGGKSS